MPAKHTHISMYTHIFGDWNSILCLVPSKHRKHTKGISLFKISRMKSTHAHTHTHSSAKQHELSWTCGMCACDTQSEPLPFVFFCLEIWTLKEFKLCECLLSLPVLVYLFVFVGHTCVYSIFTQSCLLNSWEDREHNAKRRVYSRDYKQSRLSNYFVCLFSYVAHLLNCIWACVWVYVSFCDWVFGCVFMYSDSFFLAFFSNCACRPKFNSHN